MSKAIDRLAGQLLCWLLRNWPDTVYPIPGGRAWIGWRDCFIRRIHGDAVLGGLWPRLNATYLEDQYPLNADPNSKVAPWKASTAAAAWSDALLEYWRGCPPILKLLLTCPAFLKSREMFGESLEELKSTLKRLTQSDDAEVPPDLDDEDKRRFLLLRRLRMPKDFWGCLLDLSEGKNGDDAPADSASDDAGDAGTNGQAKTAGNGDSAATQTGAGSDKGKAVAKYFWSQLSQRGQTVPGLIPDLFDIKRARAEQFSPPSPQHLSVGVKPTEVAIPQDYEDDLDSGKSEPGGGSTNGKERKVKLVRVRPSSAPRNDDTAPKKSNKAPRGQKESTTTKTASKKKKQPPSKATPKRKKSP